MNLHPSDIKIKNVKSNGDIILTVKQWAKIWSAIGELQGALRYYENKEVKK